MTIACVLPAKPIPPADLAQPLAALAREAGGEGLAFFTEPDLVEVYRPLVPGTIEALRPLADFDHVILMTLIKPQGSRPYMLFEPAHSQPLQVKTGARVTFLDGNSRLLYGTYGANGLTLGGEEVLRAVWPHADTHVFNRLTTVGSLADLDTVSFFPYGWTSRYLGMGPLNEFGFRIPSDLSGLIGRPANHKVIAVFGGSCALSMRCLPDQMFSAVLESKLNAHCRENGIDFKYTVLNYGQQGHCLLNSILTYTLFCHDIRPDVVISHDGSNDIDYGMTSDPFLLARHAITYPSSQETWCKALHNPPNKTTIQEPYLAQGLDYQVVNTGTAVVKAFLTRRRQFAAMVQSQGGVFVGGFQPFFFSKSGLSEKEKLVVDFYLNSNEPKMREILRVKQQTYDLASNNITKTGDYIYVDFHKIFKEFGSDRTLFADIVHLLPEGDAIVAEHYFQALRENCPELKRPER